MKVVTLMTKKGKHSLRDRFHIYACRQDIYEWGNWGGHQWRWVCASIIITGREVWIHGLIEGNMSARVELTKTPTLSGFSIRERRMWGSDSALYPGPFISHITHNPFWGLRLILPFKLMDSPTTPSVHFRGSSYSNNFSGNNRNSRHISGSVVLIIGTCVLFCVLLYFTSAVL